MGPYPTELNAAVTAAMRGLPVRGLLHELSVLQCEGSPLFSDSASTCFIARDAQSMRNAAWLLRRAEWLQEMVEQQEFAVMYLEGAKMVVDGETKYIPFDAWALHMGYKLGRPTYWGMVMGKVKADQGPTGTM